MIVGKAFLVEYVVLESWTIDHKMHLFGLSYILCCFSCGGLVFRRGWCPCWSWWFSYWCCCGCCIHWLLFFFLFLFLFFWLYFRWCYCWCCCCCLFVFFLIWIRSVQDRAATARHGVTRKRSTKWLKHTEIRLERTYRLKASVNSRLIKSI